MESSRIGDRAGRHRGRMGVFLLPLLSVLGAGLLLPPGAHSASLNVSAGSVIRTVTAGEVVTLAGTATGGSGTKTYAWTQTRGPTVTIRNADQASASFTAPVVTSQTWLNLLLVVTDAGGAQGSASLWIRVRPAARPPKLSAAAGTDQRVRSGEAVTLSGSATGGSGTKNYAWTQTGGSPTVTIGNANRAGASFTAPAVTARTTLTFKLTVTAGSETATDTMNVVVMPPALSVEAGTAQRVQSGTSVTLTGSATGGSGTKGYAWTQTGGSPTVTIGNADRAGASFTAPTVTARTTLTFRLTVSDASGSATDTVAVTVTAGPPLNVEAGSNQAVRSGEAVTLSGSATGGSGTKNYAWTQTGGSPTVTIGNADRASAGFTAPTVTAATTLTFRLTVSDASGSATDTVSVSVSAGSGTGTNTGTAGPPQVTGVSLASRPRSADTYRSGETVRAQVWLSELAVVSGSPSLALEIGSRTRTMSYAGPDRARVLEFEYTVQASDTDADGVSIGSGALGMPSGATLTGEAGGAAGTSLAGHAITNASEHKVDGSQSAAPPLPDLNACPAD